MAITITIDDVYGEHPSKLLEVSNFLKDIASRKKPEYTESELRQQGFMSINMIAVINKQGDILNVNSQHIPPNYIRLDTVTLDYLSALEPDVALSIVKAYNPLYLSSAETPEEVFNSQQQPNDPEPLDSLDSLDSAGLPHDLRIHSESKSINKDGTWRVRRGVKPQHVVDVEAELRAKQLEETEPKIIHASINDSGQVSLATAKPFTPPPPPPPPASPLIAPSNIISFASVMGRIARAISAGKLTKEKVIEVLKSVSPILENPAVLGQKTEFVPAVDAALTQVIGA